MRVVIFSNSYEGTMGGVEVSIALFRRGLIEAGHDVHIVAPAAEGYESGEPYIYRVPALDLSEQLNVRLAMPLKAPLALTMRGIKPALIHSQHPIWLGDVAVSFAQDLAVPLVFTFHTRYDAYAQEYVPLMPALADAMMQDVVEAYLRQCTHVIAPSPSIHDFIREQYDVDVPITVLPTPVDLGAYRDLKPAQVRSELGVAENEVLLYVGRLATEKNLRFLLHAFARIVAQRPSARLVLVGDGPAQEDLQEQAHDLGIAPQVIFTGAVPHERIADYFAAGDLFVFPSVTETQGVVLVEAMAAGTPVVAVEAPGCIDTLADGGGELVPSRQDPFVDAVLGLLSDRERLKRLGQQARKVAGQYSIPESTARLVEIYQQAVAAGPRVEGT